MAMPLSAAQPGSLLEPQEATACIPQHAPEHPSTCQKTAPGARQTTPAGRHSPQPDVEHRLYDRPAGRRQKLSIAQCAGRLQPGVAGHRSGHLAADPAADPGAEPIDCRAGQTSQYPH